MEGSSKRATSKRGGGIWNSYQIGEALDCSKYLSKRSFVRKNGQ